MENWHKDFMKLLSMEQAAPILEDDERYDGFYWPRNFIRYS